MHKRDNLFVLGMIQWFRRVFHRIKELNKKDRFVFNPNDFKNVKTLDVSWVPLLEWKPQTGDSHHIVILSDTLAKLKRKYPPCKSIIIIIFLGICFVFVVGIAGAIPVTVIFALGSIILFFSEPTLINYHVTFDRTRQKYFSNQTIKHSMGSMMLQEGSLNNVEAIQLLKKELSSRSINGIGYEQVTTYELNLVLKDKTRLNILNGGNIVEHGIQQGQQLAEFLRVPFWNVFDLTSDKQLEERQSQTIGYIIIVIILVCFSALILPNWKIFLEFLHVSLKELI